MNDPIREVARKIMESVPPKPNSTPQSKNVKRRHRQMELITFFFCAMTLAASGVVAVLSYLLFGLSTLTGLGWYFMVMGGVGMLGLYLYMRAVGLWDDLPD